MIPPNLNTLWAWNLMKALVAGGVRDVCITPGSRSTPLVWGAHHDSELRTHRLLDERSAAFFALGVAKATGRPVALVCTSGTAAANYYPAVIEAALSGVPLIVVSADRPAELRGTGASQTIDQVRLFGPYAREFFEAPLPVATELGLRRVFAGVLRAVECSMAAPRGPVHLNVPFDDPLPPVPSGDPRLAELFEALSTRPARVAGSRLLVAPEALDEAAKVLAHSRQGWIVAGPGTGNAAAVLELARRLRFPVLADVASGVRFAADPAGVRVGHHEAFLRDEAMRGLVPDVVLRIGDLPTSATLNRLIAQVDGPVLALQPDSLRRDPDARNTLTLVGSLEDALEGLLARVADRHAESPWLERFVRAEAAAAHAARHDEEGAHEVHAVAQAIAALPAGAQVFLSSSMPIRYAEALATQGPEDLQVHVSRGANGIDGIISTALGVGVGSGAPTLLVSGDLAALHDLGGMLGARLLNAPFVALVINNDGGGIFSHLPISGHPELFEPYFGTPHGLEFAPAAAMYGWHYVRVETAAQAAEAVARAAQVPGATLVELPTRRTLEAEAYQSLLARMAAATREEHAEARR